MILFSRLSNLDPLKAHGLLVCVESTLLDSDWLVHVVGSIIEKDGCSEAETLRMVGDHLKPALQRWKNQVNRVSITVIFS